MAISDLVIERIEDDTKTYIDWLKTIELDVDKNCFIVGPYGSPEYPVWPRNHDNFHYPLGMKKILSVGFSGIKKLALENAKRFEGNQREYLLLISKVYDSIIQTIQKFAEIAKAKRMNKSYHICDTLTKNAPRSFLEACQLYWFATIFRVGTATIGRIDQHLWPFCKADMKRGVIDSGHIKKIISELLLRFEKRGGGKGDTLQNITLSGKNSSGNDLTNDLTYAILELSTKETRIEPKINVRIHKNSPERLLDLVSELQLNGTGICTIFNDDAIIGGLAKHERPLDVSCNYCSDGCSEIILDGTGETAFRYVDCVKAIEHTLFNGEENVPARKKLQYYSGDQEYTDVKPPVEKGLKTGDFVKHENFKDFYDAYLKQLKYQVDIMLKSPYNSDQFPMRLFTAATMPNVIENACEPYTNPDCFHTYGLFIGSLGTAVNSIAAIKSLVYEKKLIKREDLIDALRNNFKDYSILQQLCKKAPKFGNDDDYVDSIAVDIAKKYASWVKEYKDKMGRQILPGLYNHLFQHTSYATGATPDGRQFGDPVGEHLSPTPGTATKGPTAIINSICKIDTSEQIFGSTLHLNIPVVSIKGIKNPQKNLKHINKVFCLKNGCVLNINILDSEKLLEAQRHPENFKDLIVRVWGFSYYFTQLSKEMQDHVISRATN
jgi:formate C-acetyltransferase